MKRTVMLAILSAALAAAGCGRKKNDVVGNAEASAPPAAAEAPAPGPDPALAQQTGTAGAMHDEMADDDEGGSGGNSPEQGIKGVKKWRDTGVYVDGVPKAVLGFGELPIGVKPVWIEERASVDIEPGSKGPGYKIVKMRRYRFDQYLTAIGVDVRKIKELHVMGPKFTDTIVVSGAELKKRGKEFLFRFGGEVGGKAIPVVPANFGNGRSPDKVSAVMVYVDKKPPVILHNEGLSLDGETLIKDVPYYGEPLKGGIRVYQDDRFVLHIKRPLLRDTPPDGKAADGTPTWNLLGFLQKHGVDTGKIAELYIIRHERREEKLTRAQLEGLSFEMAKKGSREIFLGPDKILTQNIAIHSKPVADADLPKVMPDEDF